MSLHYLLDGYNIIHQMPSKQLQGHDDERISFIHFLEKQQLQGRNKLSLVLDGYAADISRLSFIGVNVIFSGEVSADEKIKAMVEKAVNKKNIRVVTNDRAIQYAIRALGAQAISVDEFLGGKKDGLKAEPRSSKKLPAQTEKRITDELKDLWTKRKKQ